MPTHVARGLVLIGAGILVAGQWSVWRLIGRLPGGPFHRRWYVLGAQALTTSVDPGDDVRAQGSEADEVLARRRHEELAGRAVDPAGGLER